MDSHQERRLLKQFGFSKIERTKDARTGIVHDVIKGPLQSGGMGQIEMRPADQTRAGLSRELMDRAFILPTLEEERDDLFAAIRNCPPQKSTQYAARNGWSEDDSHFVIQERVIGKAPKGQRGLPPETVGASYRLAVAGDLEQWKSQVAGPASYSSTMLTVVAAGLATPLLRSVNISPFAMCVSGPSRSGKTVITKVAASVAGWPGDQPLPTWDMTDAAMDELLTSANDLLAPIDDLMTLEGTDTGRLKRMVDLSYKLASGRGRARHHSYDREHGAAGTWRTLALTSNEKPLAELSRTYQRPQGATVRMIDVPVILRRDDIFDALDEASPARRGELLGQLATACRSQHGSAMVALLERLLADAEVAKAEVDRHMLAFTAGVAHFSDTDLARDLARKFGLLFAAARLAKTAAVVDWSEERIEEALTRTYRAARNQLADDGKLLRDGCAILLSEMRHLPRAAQVHQGGADEIRGYRYQTATLHHCWLRNEAFDRLFTRPQRELVERWLVQEGRIEPAPSRKGGTERSVKKQHNWMGDCENRVRAVHIMWPRQRRRSER